MTEKIGYREREGEKAGGALRAVWRNKRMLMEKVKGVYEAIFVSALTFLPYRKS